MWATLASLLLPALIPAAVDGARSIIAKITGIGGGEPKTVAEAIDMMKAQTERMKALADLDNPGGEVSKWVANFRGMHRYVYADAILVGTFLYLFVIPNQDKDILNFLLNLSASVFSFFFGDRVYLHLKGGK
jgi:hypothetical protein